MKKHIILISISIIIFSCKKDFNTSNRTANLHFSNDTVIFDTTFQSIGTSTKTLIVYNQNDFGIKTNVHLEASNYGSFRINIDGNPISQGNNMEVEIFANDSIFIFLEVTPNQQSSNEFLLTNLLNFKTGKNEQKIHLVSPGKNAIFHIQHDNFINDTINYKYYSVNKNTTWTNDLPHVIYGQVVIEPGVELIIEEGTKIYFHYNSGIIVGNPIYANNTGSSLKIKGKINNKVILQGDRFDTWYQDSPGQWNKIWMTPGSINNEIDYAIIRNGSIGIHVDTIGNNQPTLTIQNSIIENMSNIGILGQGTHIEANNTIISKCGQYTVACNIGGNYNFTHCTFANYWNYGQSGSRNTPSILLNNYYEGADGSIYIRDLESANFTNCIIYGSLSTEISLQEDKSGIFNYLFDHSLIKISPDENTNSIHYNNIIKNQDPKFVNIEENDFQLDTLSPAINYGTSTNIIYDIMGEYREVPDLGAYERTLD